MGVFRGESGRWVEEETSAFSMLIERLHALPTHVKSREFERLVAWYLTAAPEYRDLVRHVYLWDEWPGRWGADAGIDLVAVTREGESWAVQAKAYAPGYSIKKADVDSFLSESNRREFSFRLLVGTTDRLGVTAARTIHEQEKPVGLKLLSQLRHDAVEWPASLEQLHPPAVRRMSPRPHQIEARDAVVLGLGGADRGQLLMACGTGKTLTSLWIDEAIGNQLTLVVVPSLSLLGQTLRTWTAQSAEPFDYLAVCSDETVGVTDSFTSWTADLGVPVTTETTTIRRFLSRPGWRRVVFSTYHSTPKVADAQRHGAPVFDLAIMDEAHRAAGRVDSSFGAVLDASRIRARKRLFMTATPRLVAAQIRGAARDRDLEMTSMDDAAKFGPTLHRLSFRDAIDRSLLSDYRVVIIGVDDAETDRAVQTRELLTIGSGVVDAETLARQIGLLRAADRFQLKRILTFHSRKATARSFANTLPAVVDWLPDDVRPAGRLWAHHITGDMNAGQREVLLDQLRALHGADYGVLTNVRCVAEGVDVPTLDGVVFVDSRRSQIDVVQAVGRAIRKSPDKKLGIVVIPVLIPPHADDVETLDASDFRTVWGVVRALRAHDDVLAEQLDAARFQLGRRGGPTELPQKIVLDLPHGVSAAFARALSARIVQGTTSAFEFWFGLLTRYVNQHETAADLEHQTEFRGHRLGAWVSAQRHLHSQGRMKPERVERLASIPGWVWRVTRRREPWEFWFALLTKYTEEHGTAAVPRPTVYDGQPLGQWAAGQRSLYARGHGRQDRIARLSALPGWYWIPRKAEWERMFSLLETYVERTGSASVPTTHLEGGEPLGRWVSKQRLSYRGVRNVGKLTPDRITKLESLPGWTWDLRSEKWERGFRALLAFATREGHSTVPHGHIEAGINLYSWVVRARHDHSTGRLQRVGGNRVARLEAIRGWRWRESRAAQWERCFSAAAKFVEREEHLEVPADHLEDGVRLRAWVERQQDDHASGKMRHAERIARLEALSGWRWRDMEPVSHPPA